MSDHLEPHSEEHFVSHLRSMLLEALDYAACAGLANPQAGKLSPRDEHGLLHCYMTNLLVLQSIAMTTNTTKLLKEAIMTMRDPPEPVAKLMDELVKDAWCTVVEGGELDPGEVDDHGLGAQLAEIFKR